MRIELNAYELSAISLALTNESIRLLDQYNELPHFSPEQDKAWNKYLWNKYLEVSGLDRKISEACRKADKKERLARFRPKAA